MDQPKKILFILGAIGDTLLFTPTIEVLARTFPKAQIDAVVIFAGSKAVLENNPAISQIFYVNFFGQSALKSFGAIRVISKSKYDLSILGYPAYRKQYHLLSRLLGAKRRLAHDFRTGHFKELAFLETDLQRVDYTAHNIENNLNLLYLLDIDWRLEVDLDKVQYSLNIKEEWTRQAEDYLQKSEIRNTKPSYLIGFHPGSTASPAALMRRWPAERYAALGDQLIKDKKAEIFIFAGPEEIEVGQQVKSLMKNQAILVDNLQLGPVMALVKKLDLFISNDSGLGHVAAAVGTPLVAIWGSTNPRLSGPKNPGKVTIIRKAKFSAWHWYEYKRAIPKGCEQLSGMEEVGVEDVLRAAEKHLNSK